MHLAAPLIAVALAASGGQPAVRLASCDPAAGTARFTGDMRAIPGASKLQMRFSVEVRPASGAGGWTRVQAPRLDVWVSADPGRARYVYDKRLAGLQPGAYRVLVRFRWRAADGSVLRDATRRSKACRVPDTRPDLVPLGVTAGPGSAPDRRTYAVTVANRGLTAAPVTTVALDVGGTSLPDSGLPALAPGATGEAVFDGPACSPGQDLVTSVDATGLVDEAQEADDVLTVPCP